MSWRVQRVLQREQRRFSVPVVLSSFLLMTLTFFPHQLNADSDSSLGSTRTFKMNERTTLVGNSPVFLNLHPIGLFLGSMSAEIGVGIGDQWAVGFLGSFAQERWLGEGYDGTSYGLWGTHFFSGYGDDSLYLKGVFEAGHMDMSKRAADVDGKNIRGAISYNQGKLLLGYRWIRDNGVSLSLGGGFNYVAAESNFDEGRVMRIGNLKAKVPNGTTRGFVPNIEFALGVQI